MSAPSDSRSYTPPTEGPDAEGIVILRDEGKKHLWDDPGKVRKWLKVFYGVCAGLLGLDLIFLFHLAEKHLSFEEGMFSAENALAFYSAYGFAACTIIVLVAKGLRKVLMRPEDYYDR